MKNYVYVSSYHIESFFALFFLYQSIPGTRYTIQQTNDNKKAVVGKCWTLMIRSPAFWRYSDGFHYHLCAFNYSKNGFPDASRHVVPWRAGNKICIKARWVVLRCGAMGAGYKWLSPDSMMPFRCQWLKFTDKIKDADCSTWIWYCFHNCNGQMQRQRGLLQQNQWLGVDKLLIYPNNRSNQKFINEVMRPFFPSFASNPNLWT